MSTVVSVSRDVRPEMEKALRRVRGVVAARIKTTSAGTVETVYVVATLSRSPRRIVRDVESVLLTLFDLSVQRDRIQVTRLLNDSESLAGGPDAAADEYSAQRSGDDGAAARLSLFSVMRRERDNRFRITVQLGRGEEIYEGEAGDTFIGHDRLRLAAEATLAAVAEMAANDVQLGLEDARETEAAPSRRAVLVTVTVRPCRRGGVPAPAALHVGSALVRTDAVDAAIRATLDAVNRLVIRPTR